MRHQFAEDRTPDTGLVMSSEHILTAVEAAALLGVHERTIRRAISRGDLPAVKRSGVFWIDLSDLDRYQVRRRLTIVPAIR